MAISYEEWLAAGNGARKDETLEQSIARTVKHQYEWNCPICHTTNSIYNSKCSSCGHEPK
jgi:transposase-like protein